MKRRKLLDNAPGRHPVFGHTRTEFLVEDDGRHVIQQTWEGRTARILLSTEARRVLLGVLLTLSDEEEVAELARAHSVDLCEEIEENFGPGNPVDYGY